MLVFKITSTKDHTIYKSFESWFDLAKVASGVKNNENELV